MFSLWKDKRWWKTQEHVPHALETGGTVLEKFWTYIKYLNNTQETNPSILGNTPHFVSFPKCCQILLSIDHLSKAFTMSINQYPLNSSDEWEKRDNHRQTKTEIKSKRSSVNTAVLSQLRNCIMLHHVDKTGLNLPLRVFNTSTGNVST